MNIHHLVIARAGWQPPRDTPGQETSRIVPGRRTMLRNYPSRLGALPIQAPDEDASRPYDLP